MYRQQIEKLKSWKDKKGRLPLIIRGARQTGKTWLMKEFGKKFFDEVAYINLETDKDLSTIFDRSIEPGNIIC